MRGFPDFGARRDSSGTIRAATEPLRIAQIAPLYEAVPPKQYGGTERVVSWLTEELVRRGHQVTLIASGDSQSKARLTSPVPRSLRAAQVQDSLIPHLFSLGLVQDQCSSFDVIHSHVDVLGLVALRLCPRPVVTTMHGRLDIPGVPPLLELAEMPLVSISDAQREPAPKADWVCTIYHGLPTQEYAVGAGEGDFVVFLGRISPEKRPDAAIRIARRAGVHLVIAAKVDPVDRAYFEEVIQPLLKEPGVDFIGEVDERQKVDLLGKARALLFPIFWPEPFGLAMIESLACGTPVLTRRCGSTTEVIDDPRVGVVCDDDDQIVEALLSLERFDRSACRAYVERRFSVERMADDYEALYRELCAPRVPGSSRERADRSLALVNQALLSGDIVTTS